jgi:hypothetical protein
MTRAVHVHDHVNVYVYVHVNVYVNVDVDVIGSFLLVAAMLLRANLASS